MSFRIVCLLAVVGFWFPQTILAATVVWFDEQEPGTDPHVVRMVFTKQYLRIDDGVAESDYVLFDRSKKRIYSVNHEDQTVIEIDATPVTMKKPEPFVQEARPLEMKQGPPIKDATVRLYQLITNGKNCGEVAAAKGLLTDAVEALKGFHQTLAAEQAVATQQMPKHLQNDCDLSENIFAPGGYLKFGFPVFYRSFTGRTRSLKRLDESYSAPPELFQIPDNYRRFSPAKLRAGKG